MKINYKAKLLEELIAKNKLLPIESVELNQSEFDEVFDEAKASGLVTNYDLGNDSWADLHGLGFSIHLDRFDEE